ncbi:MAG: hypothetical protein KAT32_03625 [Candidatus Moranbacteria bacterium]|nr:hypothetical protein [Candidatus Moranbacteria bacterium]
MDKKQKIEKLLEVSGFLNDDRIEFSQILSQLTEVQIDMMIELVVKDNGYARFFLENYREKKEIIASGDKGRLERLLEKEKRVIEKLSAGEKE